MGWHAIVCYIMVCYALLFMVWYGMVWYGMVWYGRFTWYGMETYWCHDPGDPRTPDKSTDTPNTTPLKAYHTICSNNVFKNCVKTCDKSSFQDQDNWVVPGEKVPVWGEGSQISIFW